METSLGAMSTDTGNESLPLLDRLRAAYSDATDDDAMIALSSALGAVDAEAVGAEDMNDEEATAILIGTVEPHRNDLTDQAVHHIVREQISRFLVSAAEYDRLGRAGDRDTWTTRAGILEALL